MKHALLFLLIVPFTLNARVDPRISKVAPYEGVKTMDVTYIFVIRSGNDTGMSESFRYNETGMLTDYSYDQHLMKNPHYHTNSTYRYKSKDAWTQTTYRNQKISDSAVVNGSWANHYWWHDGKISQLNEFRRDSFAERNIVNGDTVLKHMDYGNPPRDEFWDYSHAGKFASKSSTRSANTDTIRYLDANGKCLVMIVNFYDSNFRPVKTDYYNFKVKRFDLFYMPYNEKMDMIFFLNKSKKGQWSFEITRKYNEKGWLIEEYCTDARPYKGANGTPMLKLYKYTLY